VTTAATCDKAGIKTFTCTKCGHSYTESIPAKGHNWNSATCTAPKTCKTCGATSGKANGHSYSNGVCVNCGQAQPSCTHKNTKTEKVESTCSTQGYEKVICKDCGKTISSKKLPIGTCSFTKTMNLAEAAAKYFDDTFDTEFAVYEAYTDWLVNVCPECGYLDIDSRRFAHSAMEEAEIMLGYVNDLREDVYGTNVWNLKLDAKLVELAQIRAKELYKNFSHSGGSYTNASENIAKGYETIKTQFDEWKASSGHYSNMTYNGHEYFGYARYEAPNGTVYAVQLFWSELGRDTYFAVTEG
jgi:uncharacterized protein YkwD